MGGWRWSTVQIMLNSGIKGRFEVRNKTARKCYKRSGSLLAKSCHPSFPFNQHDTLLMLHELFFPCRKRSHYTRPAKYLKRSVSEREWQIHGLEFQSEKEKGKKNQERDIDYVYIHKIFQFFPLFQQKTIFLLSVYMANEINISTIFLFRCCHAYFAYFFALKLYYFQSFHKQWTCSSCKQSLPLTFVYPRS